MRKPGTVRLGVGDATGKDAMTPVYCAHGTESVRSASAETLKKGRADIDGIPTTETDTRYSCNGL